MSDSKTDMTDPTDGQRQTDRAELGMLTPQSLKAIKRIKAQRDDVARSWRGIHRRAEAPGPAAAPRAGAGNRLPERGPAAPCEPRHGPGAGPSDPAQHRAAAGGPWSAVERGVQKRKPCGHRHGRCCGPTSGPGQELVRPTAHMLPARRQEKDMIPIKLRGHTATTPSAPDEPGSSASPCSCGTSSMPCSPSSTSAL